MIVVIDSSVLLHLIEPGIGAARDSSGSQPEHCTERLRHFIDQMSKTDGRIVIPTPVLAEVLVHAGAAGQDWLNVFRGQKAIKVIPFDEMAAVECAALSLERKSRSRLSTRAKSKFDEQIIAIAVVANAEMILSDDSDIHTLAPRSIAVKGIGDLDLPPDDPQGALFKIKD